MKEVETLEIDGKEFFLVDKINNYYYFSNTEDVNDFKIFKEEEANLIPLDTESEFNNALILYMNNHKENH